MNPAWSVIFLTTLTGAGQGLFLALYGVEISAGSGLAPPAPVQFYTAGSVVSIVLLIAGLGASFLHLGHPERAWRAAAMWRTSWLSREVIVLPAFIAAVFVYGAAHHYAWSASGRVGAIATVLCIALFVCTGMIYACLKFLQEWHTPFTLINFFMLGTASGLMLAAALAAFVATALTGPLGVAAIIATALALIPRVASLMRNARIRSKSSLQSAIGVKHPRIAQKSQGQMGGSFNTREFFHGRGRPFVRAVKWIFLVLGFALPVVFAGIGLLQHIPSLLAVAAGVQFVGLVAERWFFFAQARHPQNLYYQVVS